MSELEKNSLRVLTEELAQVSEEDRKVVAAIAAAYAAGKAAGEKNAEAAS